MKRFWAAGLFALVVSAGSVQAAMITDVETVGGRDVEATADFQMGDGKLTLTLRNITSPTADASQLLSGVRFTLGNGETPVTTAGFTASGTERTVFGDGTYSDSGRTALSWELVPGKALQIDFHPDSGDALIGPANGEEATNAGVYAANGSIMGNAGHNPFAAGDAYFTLTSPEIVSTTNVWDVSFMWGTTMTAGVTLETATAPVPEPATIGVLGCGVVMLLRRRGRVG